MKKDANPKLDRVASQLAGQRGYGTPSFSFLGTEARVYRLGETEVLKLYDEANLNQLRTLKRFYDNADTTSASISIPQILDCGSFGGVAYSVERRVLGVGIVDIPNYLTNEQVADAYITAALSIKEVRVANHGGRRRLFDEASSTTWRQYLHNAVSTKLRGLKETLPSAVFEKLGPVDALVDFCKFSIIDADELIHGDIHPGNVFIHEDHRVSAVIDFGTFTMFGDATFDIATACGFFSMYEPEQVDTRKKLIDRCIQRDNSLVRSQLNGYLLVAAILTCDLYPDGENLLWETGHFRWALSVLEDADMWSVL